jgi:hypothetical protein
MNGASRLLCYPHSIGTFCNVFMGANKILVRKFENFGDKLIKRSQVYGCMGEREAVLGMLLHYLESHFYESHFFLILLFLAISVDADLLDLSNFSNRVYFVDISFLF